MNEKNPASSQSPSQSELRERAGGNAERRRKRSTGRIYWLPRGLTPVAQLCFALALSALLPVYVALPVAVLGYVAMLTRFKQLLHERRRPKWLTRFVDIPLFWHWGASGIAALTSPLWLLFWGIANFIAQGSSRSLLGSASLVALSAYGIGLLISGFALTIGRRSVRVRQIDVALPNLPKAFDGYRIAQLSDLHIGSFDDKERGCYWANLANSLNADLIVVTGDLVTSGTSFYEDVRDVLRKLRAPDGVVVSMGNHDQWDNERLTRLLVAEELVVLRNQARNIERGDAAISIAGLDDAYAGRANLQATLRSRTPGVPTILLSHYPQFFTDAADAGVELVLSGHTHGGQLGVPFFGDRYNISTLRGDYARGVYRRNDSTLYVNAGLGTTGPPMRLGIPPEIALIVLKAS